GAPRPALCVLWQWIGLGIGFFLARQLIRFPLETRAVLAVMVAMAVASAVYGYYQVAVEIPQTRRYYEDELQPSGRVPKSIDQAQREARL
ncbi:hypothetical protein L9G74_20865, partial [Shewanella sp. C32]